MNNLSVVTKNESKVESTFFFVAIPLAPTPQTTASTAAPVTNSQKITVANTNIRDGLQRLTQTVTVKQGDSVQRISVPAGFAQLVSTATGRHILFTSNQQNANTGWQKF